MPLFYGCDHLALVTPPGVVGWLTICRPGKTSCQSNSCRGPVCLSVLSVDRVVLSGLGMPAGYSNRVSPGAGGGYPWRMDTTGPRAVRTQYQARPGRRAIVVTELGSLHGPARGTVELPLRLFWSSPDRTFDLGNPFQRRWLYQTVLREASRPEDLIRYLDEGTLIALWPDLRVPAGVRQAWEEHHPVLRAAAARSA